MSVLYPGFLWAAGVASLGVVGLHWLTTLQPHREFFPPVRFIPEAAMHSTARAVRFSDPLLLIVRVLALLMIGLGLAQPHLNLWQDPVARIVLVDDSSAIARTPARQEEVTKATAGAQEVIRFQSLSGALVQALRAASRLQEHARRIEIRIVSPFAAEAFDRSTPHIRALWPGPIELVRVPAAAPGSAPVPVKVEWASPSSALWNPRTPADHASGVTSPAATLIASFDRRWRLAVTPDEKTVVIARWLDGEPAVVEQRTGSGIVRSVGFSIPIEGDVALRPEFVHFEDWLNAPPDPTALSRTADAATLSALAGADKKEGVVPTSIAPTSLSVWLLALGAGLLLLELLLPRRVHGTAAS